MQVKEAAHQRLAFLKKKLLSSIEKTEPFVQLWRKAKDVSLVDGKKKRWMDGWMDRGTDGWKDGELTDGRTDR